MRVLLAANRCSTTDWSFDVLQTLCEQVRAAAGANSSASYATSPAAALTINAPKGRFDPSTEASQASRHGPEGKRS